MGSLITDVVTFFTTEPGTNFKKLVDWFLENCADLKIIQTESDTTSKYGIYVCAYDNTDEILRLYNSSTSVYVESYHADESGTYTISDRTYIKSNKAISSFSMHNLGANASFPVFAVKNESGIVLLAKDPSASNPLTLYFLKHKDVITGEELHFAGPSMSSLWAGTRTGGEYSVSAITNVQSTNSYVRVYPLTFNSGDSECYTQAMQPTDFCRIEYGAGSLSPGVGRVVKIAGHRFVQISTSVFARID